MNRLDLHTALTDALTLAATKATRLVVAACPDCVVDLTHAELALEGKRRGASLRWIVTVDERTSYVVSFESSGWTAAQVVDGVHTKRGDCGDDIATVMGGLLAPLVAA